MNSFRMIQSCFLVCFLTITSLRTQKRKTKLVTRKASREWTILQIEIMLTCVTMDSIVLILSCPIGILLYTHIWSKQRTCQYYKFLGTQNFHFSTNNFTFTTMIILIVIGNVKLRATRWQFYLRITFLEDKWIFIF